MAYSELIKNFSNIREYIRQFYVYGFKSRSEYNAKSARSYDNERRRIESWMGEYMTFRNDSDGKRVFLSVDSRSIESNPLYNAFKAKSFTSGDITFHFYILDLLSDGVARPISKILKGFTDDYLSFFSGVKEFDESTVRKKLNEYVRIGLLKTEKKGKEVLYSINNCDVNTDSFKDAVAFFSEVSPVGIVGSFIADKSEKTPSPFCFKHHYILNAIDSQIMYELLLAINEKYIAEITVKAVNSKKSDTLKVSPCKIYISTQNGRQYVFCRNEENSEPLFIRTDNIKNVKLCEKSADIQSTDLLYEENKDKIWGVSLGDKVSTERVELKIHIEEHESYILQRLHREKRCGKIEKIDNSTYLFTAQVYDSNELLPWIRTFLGRIKSFKCSNNSTVQRFYADLNAMYDIYGGESSAVQ